MLIFSLVPTPLPQPHFHNIRHHDAPGEVCEHHDHLLRWHPGASAAADVAILHWHWFLPTSGSPDGPPSGAGPAIHAHVSDGLASTWDDGPRVLPDGQTRSMARPLPGPWIPWDACLPDQVGPGLLASRPHPSFPSGAPFAPRATLASLLQRWTC